MSFEMPYRGLGKLITTNETVFSGDPSSAQEWLNWGQTDIQPFGDESTTFEDLP